MRMKANMPGGPRSQPTSLTVVAKTWPTPNARDQKGAFTGHRQGGRDLPSEACGHHDPTTATDGGGRSEPACLNPPFVEWLMGWPIGWTDCTRSATESFRLWLRSHSDALLTALGSTSEGEAA
jgi:hypothetical protein